MARRLLSTILIQALLAGAEYFFSRTPTPIQSGFPPGCKDFSVARPGDTCDSFAMKHGFLDTAQFLAGNPQVGGKKNCPQNLLAWNWYCLDLAGDPDGTTASTIWVAVPTTLATVTKQITVQVTVQVTASPHSDPSISPTTVKGATVSPLGRRIISNLLAASGIQALANAIKGSAATQPPIACVSPVANVIKASGAPESPSTSAVMATAVADQPPISSKSYTSTAVVWISVPTIAKVITAIASPTPPPPILVSTTTVQPKGTITEMALSTAWYLPDDHNPTPITEACPPNNCYLAFKIATFLNDAQGHNPQDWFCSSVVFLSPPVTGERWTFIPPELGAVAEECPEIYTQANTTVAQVLTRYCSCYIHKQLTRVAPFPLGFTKGNLYQYNWRSPVHYGTPYLPNTVEVPRYTTEPPLPWTDCPANNCYYAYKMAGTLGPMAASYISFCHKLLQQTAPPMTQDGWKVVHDIPFAVAEECKALGPAHRTVIAYCSCYLAGQLTADVFPNGFTNPDPGNTGWRSPTYYTGTGTQFGVVTATSTSARSYHKDVIPTDALRCVSSLNDCPLTTYGPFPGTRQRYSIPGVFS